MSDNKGPLLTRYEAARYLKISPVTLDRRWRKVPDFPQPINVGSRFIYFFEKDIIDYINKFKK